MVIAPDVDPPVVEARVPTAVPDDEDRRALLAPLVAAGPLPGAQRREQTDGQVALRHLEGPGQRLQDFLPREDVPLGREISADDMPRLREAFFPGIRRGAAPRVDDADLALGRVFVRRHELLHDVLRCDPPLQHRERLGSVRGVRVRLGRDRSDPSRGERHDGPDRDEFGFDDDAWVTYVQRINAADWDARGYADVVDDLDARHLLDIFERAGVTNRPADALVVSRELEREAMAHVNARYPDARTAIERLRAAGHRVYVATGGGATNDAALRGAGLFDLIDGIFTGHSQNAQKGQSRYWREIPDQLGVEPMNCVLVDDRLDYLEAAASVGIVALLLDRKAAHRPESMPPHLGATPPNPAGLPHWVELWTATRHD